MRLAVELYGTRVATLEGDSRTFEVTPSPEGLERFGTGSSTLSVTIPLVPRQRREHAGRRRNWFAELLPEGDQLDHMLQQSALRRGDTIAFLARYGRDIAGALQLWNIDDPTEPQTPSTRPLTAADIRRLLEDPIGAPLANDPESGKSSLGGVQPKIVLARTTRGWEQAGGGYPTSHILKPRLGGERASIIFDEEYGARIARGLGLLDYSTSVEDFDGLSALVIERYDRVDGQRVHQEDFNQVLGASGNQKYQEIGGVVSLARIAGVLTKHAPPEDLVRLARMTVLAVAIGNLDMHTKNLGLLHFADGRVTLAPAYDTVPQAHMSNDGRLALAINKKYRHEDITRADLNAEFTSWGLRHPESTIDGTLDRIDAVLASEAPLQGAFPGLREQIALFVGRVRG